MIPIGKMTPEQARELYPEKLDDPANVTDFEVGPRWTVCPRCGWHGIDDECPYCPPEPREALGTATVTGVDRDAGTVTMSFEPLARELELSLGPLGGITCNGQPESCMCPMCVRARLERPYSVPPLRVFRMDDGVPVTQLGFMMVTALGRWHLGEPVLVEMCDPQWAAAFAHRQQRRLDRDTIDTTLSGLGLTT